MALQKQLVPLPIDRGLDTKLDPKQEEIGYLRKAENIVYETLKELRKRNGYDQVDLYDLSNDSIETPILLSKYKTELIALSETKLYAYASGRQRWINRGSLHSSSQETHNIIKNANAQTEIDSLYVEGFSIFVWADSSGGVRYSVQDLENDSFLVSDAPVSATGERPVLAHIQGYVYIIYGDGVDLNARKFSILSPSELSVEVTIASNRDITNGLIDAESSDTKIVVAYNSSTELSVFTVDQNDNVSSIIGVTGENADMALDVMITSAFRIIITYSNGTAVKYVIFPFTLAATILPPTTIEAIANVKTCYTIEREVGIYRAYYEVAQVGTADNYVKQADTTVAGVVTNIAVFKRSVGLGSRGFVRNDETYIMTVHESEVQASYFLFHETGYLVTKFANQTAGGVVNYGVLQPVLLTQNDQYLVSLIIRNRLESDNGTFFSTTGIAASILNFSPEFPYSSALMAEALHICAGVLRFYDGNTVSEHGFHVFPEILSNTPSATGGFMSDGNYGYVAVYRWTDNNGRDHRSAPTQTPLTAILSGGGSVQSNAVTVPTLRITDKTNVVIELYRTENNGTTYYMVTSNLSPTFNDPDVDNVTIVDTTSDADLISNELLYTTGGVLENIPAPACFQITGYNSDRLAVVGEESNRVFFSKQMGEGRPIEFTDAIYRDVDPVGGPIIAIQSMIDKLIIFEADAFFYVSGDAPNNLGQQDNLIKPDIISSDIGCINPTGVVLTPQGVMFKSRKGIWQVTPGLSLQYLGARAERFNSQTVTSAQIVGELNQIRFTLDTDRALVYNYNLDRWATFENHGALSAVVIENDYYYLREDGVLYKENRSTFSDAGSPIRMRLETGWMTFAELQGYVRAYHAMLLGSFKSSHKLRVKVAYDFVDAWVQEKLIDPLDFMNPTTYGEDSPYGSGSPYGGDGNLYEMRVDFMRQKCTSMKLLIEDAQDEVGEGLSLSGITLRVGAKEGTNKLAANRKFGTN